MPLACLAGWCLFLIEARYIARVSEMVSDVYVVLVLATDTDTAPLY
jgi:hypothetical protein